jgi:polyisoprenoid-binding protein YceI
MNPSTWNTDPAHSAIHFSARHLVVSKVRGRFDRWNAALTLDGEDLENASVTVTIDASSIDTGVADRDKHLRSADFLNVAEHPNLEYRSRKVERISKNELRVTGDLTIAGVTREVSLEVLDAGRAKDPWGNEKALFSARTSIDRREFGLAWNQVLEAGGVLVGDRVEIEIELQAVKAAAKAA